MTIPTVKAQATTTSTDLGLLHHAIQSLQSSPPTWQSSLLSNLIIFVLGSPLLRSGLSLPGIGAAFLLGTLTWRAFGPSAFLLVATYFVIGTGATKLKMAQKEAQGVAEKRKGRRGPGSVIGSSAAGCVCAFLSIFGVGGSKLFHLLELGFVASFCTKLSDTVSSEIGKAYGKTTYLVTTFKIVPRGTEGAVSVEGTVAGLLASILLSFVGYLMGEINGPEAVICVVASQIANLGESVIGASLQEKEGFRWLNNDAVNVINISIGSILAVLIRQIVLQNCFFPISCLKKMASSPLQEIILASSPDGIITAFDASSGTTLARFTGSRSPRKGLVVIGNNLIAASHVSSDTAAASIHLYNWWSSTTSHHIPITEPVGPLAATFDGSYLFAGGLSGHVHALSVPSSDTIRTVFAHRKPVSCLAINDDGSLLFSGSDDGTIAVFPIYKLLENTSCKSNQLVLHRFNGHESTVTSVTTGIGASNCTIISCSLDCSCKFWSLMHGTHLCTVAFPCTIWGVEMDPTESEFYVAGSDGSVYNGAIKGVSRHVVKQGHKLVTWTRKHKGAVIALAMMNGGQNLVTASDNGSIWIWDVFRKEVVTVLGEEMGSISELVVVKGFGFCGSHGLGASEGNDEFSRWRSGFTSRELSRPMREVTGMEQTLGVLAQDRSKAIDTLGSAIQTYEKLLGLVLKEAKVGSNLCREYTM